MSLLANSLLSSGDEVANPSTVTPWLFAAVDLPPALTGLLVPPRAASPAWLLATHSTGARRLAPSLRRCPTTPQVLIAGPSIAWAAPFPRRAVMATPNVLK